MNVNFDRGSRGVARSFRKEICIFAPGSCMPACQANWGCFSRKRTFGEGALFGAVSWRAMAIAREAGPNPMQRRSRVSLAGEERGWCVPFVRLLSCMVESSLSMEEIPFKGKLERSSVGVLIADGAILTMVDCEVEEVT